MEEEEKRKGEKNSQFMGNRKKKKRKKKKEKNRAFNFRCSDDWKSIGQELKLLYSTRAMSRF